VKLSLKILSISVLGILALSGLLPLTIVHATTTGPLKEIQVDGEYTGPGYGAYQSNTTSSSGSYAFSKVYTAGSYDVTASGDGFIQSSPQSTSVTLGHATTGVDVNLLRSSIVTGQVTGPTGAPVVGATVQLKNSTTGNDVGTSDFTTSDGQYAIETDVPQGSYNITVIPPEGDLGLFLVGCFTYATICPVEPTYVPGFMSQTVGVVAVGLDAEVTRNIQLSASAAIAGRVTYNGVGVTGVEVGVNGTCGSCTSVTNSTGYYAIANDLVGGVYNVTLSTSLYPPLSAPVIAQGSAIVTASAGHVATQDFTLGASAKVSGYVKDNHGNPVAGVTVDIGQNSFFGVTCGGSFFPCAENTTDSSGHYELTTNLGTGMFNITATKDFYAEGWLSSLLSVVAGGSSVAPDITITATPGVTPAHITGTVKDSHGNPVNDALVSGRGTVSGTYNETFTDASGNFNLELRLGYAQTVNLTASDAGYVQDSILTSSITPGSTNPEGTLTITAITPGSISGTVQGQILPLLIQPVRTQVWVTMSGAIFVTKTDSEQIFVLFGMVLSGNTISDLIQGPDGTTGTFTIQIPRSALNPTSGWTVMVDTNVVTPTSVTSNATYWVISLSYSHSSHTLTFTANGVVPEFPTAALPFVLLAVMSISVVMIRVVRRKKSLYPTESASDLSF